MEAKDKLQGKDHLVLDKHEASCIHKLSHAVLTDAGIPNLYWEQTLKTLRCKKTGEFLFNYMHRLDKDKEKKSLLVFSEDQTASVSAAVMGKLFLMRNKTVKWFSYYDAVTKMFDQWKSKDQEKMTEVFDPDLLVLDSVGIKSSRNEISVSFLEYVIDKRIKSGKKTFLVSKIPIHLCDQISFSEVYSQCFSTIKEAFYLIETES